MTDAVFFRILSLIMPRDLSCIGSKFTWTRGGLSQRLDQALCNEVWDAYFPNHKVRNLLRLKVEHQLVLVDLNSMGFSGSHPFRCLGSWMLHGDFHSLIHRN